jgi:hypothetical protein
MDSLKLVPFFSRPDRKPHEPNVISQNMKKCPTCFQDLPSKVKLKCSNCNHEIPIDYQTARNIRVCVFPSNVATFVTAFLAESGFQEIDRLLNLYPQSGCDESVLAQAVGRYQSVAQARRGMLKSIGIRFREPLLNSYFSADAQTLSDVPIFLSKQSHSGNASAKDHNIGTSTLTFAID